MATHKLKESISTVGDTSAVFGKLVFIEAIKKLPILIKSKVCIQTRWLIMPELIVGFVSMKRLRVFLLPPGWDVTLFARTHLYIWVERGTEKLTCLAQEHNTMSSARPRTRTARSGHEAIARITTDCHYSVKD